MKKNAQTLYLLLYRIDERKTDREMGCVGVYSTPQKARKKMRQEYCNQCREIGRENLDMDATAIHSRNASVLTNHSYPDQYEWTIVSSVVPIKNYRRFQNEADDNRTA